MTSFRLQLSSSNYSYFSIFILSLFIYFIYRPLPLIRRACPSAAPSQRPLRPSSHSSTPSRILHTAQFRLVSSFSICRHSAAAARFTVSLSLSLALSPPTRLSEHPLTPAHYRLSRYLSLPFATSRLGASGSLPPLRLVCGSSSSCLPPLFPIPSPSACLAVFTLCVSSSCLFFRRLRPPLPYPVPKYIPSPCPLPPCSVLLRRSCINPYLVALLGLSVGLACCLCWSSPLISGVGCSGLPVPPGVCDTALLIYVHAPLYHCHLHPI